MHLNICNLHFAHKDNSLISSSDDINELSPRNKKQFFPLKSIKRLIFLTDIFPIRKELGV